MSQGIVDIKGCKHSKHMLISLFQTESFPETAENYVFDRNILTHTSNAKCFRNVTLINIRGLAEIIVSVRGYGRHSPKQVMIKRE